MSTSTPNYGLIVPEATDTVAQVRADYATNLGIIDNISGGGGGGGGNVYGAFVNTNRIITSGAYTSANPLSYTATEDCYIYSAVSLQPSTGGSVRIDGELVGNWYNGGALSAYNFEYYLRKGQTLTATQTYSGTTDYVVYGLIQGTESIFTPTIYSDNERMIGIWRNNKPLYQKSFPFTVNLSGGQTATIATISDYEDIVYLNGWLNESNIFYAITDPSLRVKVSSSGQLQLYCSTGLSWSGSGYVTLQYTKSSDVAGSGNWNTDGIPMAHYSTTEQVIGTYLGKPLYQITADFGSEITVNSNTWTNTTIPTTDKKAIISVVGTNGSGTCWNFISANCDSGSYVQVYHTRSSAITLLTMTIQYTKTTD